MLALYGGPDFVANSRNWATTPRPTASTFKTYALAAGLDNGFSLRSTFNGNTFTPPGDPTPVRNEFSNQYGSNVTLLRATADSINTAFVDLTTEMKGDGPDKIMKMAEAVGAPKGAGWDNTSRVALGTAEVSPLDQAGAYATFANGGIHVANHVVREVRDADDKIIYTAAPEEKRAVSEDIARDVNYALSNVVEQGTGGTVRTLNRPVAGKTGTKDVKDDIISAWFVAYTPQISTAVMYVAGADGNGDLDGFARPGDSTFFGGTYPALTWADYMQTAMEDLPVEDFDEPAYVNARRRRRASRSGRTRARATTSPVRAGGARRDRGARPRNRRSRRARSPASRVRSRSDAGAESETGEPDRRSRRSRRPTAEPSTPSREPEEDTQAATDEFSSAGIRPWPETIPRGVTASSAASANDSAARSAATDSPAPAGGIPTRVALLTATAVYLIGVMFRLPCRMTVAGQVPDVYRNLCYSDIGVLYGPRGLLEGNTPVPGLGELPGAGVSGALRRLPGAGAAHHGRSGRPDRHRAQ